MQKIHSLIEETAISILGPDALRVSKMRASHKHEQPRRGAIAKGRRRFTDDTSTNTNENTEQGDHQKRVDNTRRIIAALPQQSLIAVDASLKDALSRLEQLITFNTSQSNEQNATQVKQELDERPARGRGRPHGSVSKNNGQSSISSSSSSTSSTSTSATFNKSLTAKKTNVNASSTTTTSTSSNTEKLVTIGARYGYPAPPPLSTYNGKFGRSLYSSPYNPSAPILPNSQVAYSRGGPGGADEWILCRVLRVLSETRFEIQDPEPDAAHPQGQVFRATSKEVLLVPLQLPEASAVERLKPYKAGSKVLAQYPETTTFYRAEVVETRGKTCMLRFEGEEDVDKLTPVERVFVLPYPER